MDIFFQRPHPIKPTNENSPWFMNAVVGEKKLQSMMKEISQLASLSCTYTNHCIRATTCTILDRAGHKTHEIMAVTGHKNESSVRSYVNRLSIGQKQKLSESLSGMSAQLATGSATVSNTSTANSLMLTNMANCNAVIQQGVHGETERFTNVSNSSTHVTTYNVVR